MAKIHAYQQLEHSDCGITCIRIIADYWGKRMPLQRLRDLCDMSRGGISIKELTAGLEKTGLHSVPLNLPRDEVRRMPLPAIIYWNQNHFVVLYKVSDDGTKFFIADPAQGKIKVDDRQFFESWCSDKDRGIVILAEPGDNFMPENQKGEKPVRKLAGIAADTLSRHRHSFMAVILLAVLSMSADVALPLLMKHTIDEGIANADIPLVWLLVLSQLCIFLGGNLTNTLSDYIITRLGLKMGMEMLGAYLTKLIRLPMDFFERKVKSDLIQKTEDQSRIKDFMLTTPQTLLFAILSLVIFSGLLMYFSMLVFSVFLILTLAGMAWSVGFMRRRKAIDYSLSVCMSENRNNLYELVHGMQEIKSNNAEEVRVKRWRQLQEKANRLSMKSYFVKFFISSGQNLITQLRDIAITGLCATLVIKGNLTLGGMMTISYIVGRLAQPFSVLVSSIFSIQDASMSYERIDEILNSPPAPDNLLKKFSHGNLRLEHLSFKYPGAGAPYVLEDISLTINRGDTVAFVGPSGCGKSTLMKILLGLFKPSDGNIFTGNTSLADIDPAEWLKCCTIVMQSGTIFSGTIAENIALNEEYPDMARVKKAAEIACLDEFINTLPMGYHSRLGVAGIEFSGGQRQRLLIARAVYKAPEIIILDEATSSLDAINECTIVKNIQKFKQTRTLIVAAHRLSTISHADVIHYIDKGRIIESGSHSELMALNGAYAAMISGQLEIATRPTT